VNLITYNLETLHRLSAFVLNRTTNDLRSELYEYLVMMALSEDKQNRGMTAPEIISSIEKDLKVEKFPNSLVKSAIRRLKDKQFIETVHGKGGDLYLLSQDKRNKIKLMREQYTQTLTRVREKLAKRIGKIIGAPLDMNLEIMVFITFQNFLGTVLSSLGAECCFAIVGSRGKRLNSLKPIDMLELLDDILGTVKEKELQKAEKQAFLEYISDPDDDLSDYIYSLAQSYFIIQVLHLDPECQSYTKESLQRKKVYLDTNVIVHSLTGVKRRTKAVDTALKLTKELGIEIVFSKRTKEEFDNLVVDSRRTFGKNPIVPIGRFEKLRNQLKDGFLKDFLIKKKKNPNLTFDRYTDRLEEIETVLKNRFSANYDDNTYKEIYEHPDMPQLKKIVIDEGVRFGLFKTDSVAEHDAFHILLIQELRKKETGDVLGPNYWFLTHDRSLYFVEKRFGKYEKFPSSIFIDNWVQLISPLLTPEQTKNARDAYASLFASRLPILTKTIDGDVFLAYQGKWMDDEDLTAQDVARVIGNRYIKDYYEEIKEEGRQITEEERDMIIMPLIEEIKSQKKEREEVRQELTSLKQATTRLQTETKELKQIITLQNNILDYLGYAVGAISFLVMWYMLFQFILIHRLEAWQAFIGALIISLIFGYLAGFRGYKWLVDRILKYSLKR